MAVRFSVVEGRANLVEKISHIIKSKEEVLERNGGKESTAFPTHSSFYFGMHIIDKSLYVMF